MSKNSKEIDELKQQNLDLALRLERYEHQFRRMQLINDIAEAANRASTPHEAVRLTLSRICITTDWPLGHAYFSRIEDHKTELVSSRVWHINEGGDFEKFIALSESLRFKPGQGLPGIVLRDREALWANAIRSDAKRFALGRKIGIQSAFAFPIMMGDKVAAVLEFFSGQNLAADEILLDIVSQLGMLLGRVFERAFAAEERVVLNNQLIKASRRAGMAEVASGVLHDIGNVLNSVAVSSNLMKEQLDQNISQRVCRLTELLQTGHDDLKESLNNEDKGTKITNYIDQLAKQLRREQDLFGNELMALLKNVDHITNIIHRQQDHATPSSAKEYVSLNHLIDDALIINNLWGQTDGIKVEKKLADIHPLFIDKHNLVQVLDNLISNAKQALERNDDNPTIVISTSIDNDNDSLSVCVSDNGCGIPVENQNNIFNFGFTTKKSGHGFGLHTSANAAQNMGGELSFTSEGYGRGTEFKLTLPMNSRIQH
jgi:signal transduction histidine kinase